MVAAGRIEFRSTYDANDGSGRTSSDTASNNLMPNMTERDANQVFEKNRAALRVSDAVHPVQLVDETQAARGRVVDFTARQLASGNLSINSMAGQTLRAAIEHQLKAGGAAAADSLAEDITAKLPNGMKLEIRRNEAFEANAKKFFAQNGDTAPTYIRWVELKDAYGQVLGGVGITGDAFANRKPVASSMVA
ncbi:hypothetical protein KF707_03015 [Candidatus Obscuribacterales bacterium]|nr:hypothetical protein [Candidatus Obscuribacterales bacterium]MBX3135180.1 hypothetical protein [Candidatus Obscuribacterales bacterium]